MRLTPSRFVLLDFSGQTRLDSQGLTEESGDLCVACHPRNSILRNRCPFSMSRLQDANPHDSTNENGYRQQAEQHRLSI
jgi:hypothetical protein